MFQNDPSTSPPPAAKPLAIPVQTMNAEQLEILRKLNERYNQKQGTTICVNPPQIPPQNADQPQPQPDSNTQE